MYYLTVKFLWQIEPTTFYDILPPSAQNKHKSKKGKKMKK
jgi:hypothetical protein